MELNKNSDSLEKALSAPGSNPAGQVAPEQVQEISKEEEISFHKGALNTLVNERTELFKMMQNVETVMQAHLKRLEELGVKIQKPEPEQK